MQTQDYYDPVRSGLVAMLPRLQRFADVLAGGRDAGHGLLRRSLRYMLAEQHRYQRGTSMDVWAFSEIYRQWRHELSGESDPMTLAKIDDVAFGALFDDAEPGYRARRSSPFSSHCRPNSGSRFCSFTAKAWSMRTRVGSSMLRPR